MAILAAITFVFVLWYNLRNPTKPEPKKATPAAPMQKPVIAAAAIRHTNLLTPAGSQSTDYVFPCPKCETSHRMNHFYPVTHDFFTCSACGQSIKLVLTLNQEPDSIVEERVRIAQQLSKPVGQMSGAELRRYLDEIAAAPATSDEEDEDEEPPRKPAKRKRPSATRMPSSKPKQEVLAGGLKIQAEITYGRGTHPGERRHVLITSVTGFHNANGEMDVHLLRCACGLTASRKNFIVEHITSLADGETGEVVPDVRGSLNKKLAAWV